MSFSNNMDGVMVRVSPADSASQKYVTITLHARIRRPCHYSLLAGRPGKHLVYYIMSRKLYWPHNANKMYTTVRDCQSYAQNRHTSERQRKMLLFPPNVPLEFVGIDIICALLKTRTGNQYVVVVIGRYSKLT